MSKTLSSGARQLPLRHISIRVPWNDTGWNGVVCKKPADNISCLILRRIRASRDDAKETQLAGKSWEELTQEELPSCMSERGQFMAPFEITRRVNHPYVDFSKAHKHLRPTIYRHPAFSASAVPYSWMLRETAEEKITSLELGYQQDIETRVDETMGFETNWIQEKDNQLALLDTFFSAIQPKKSLAFFYGKRTPLVDDASRVLIGVGWVTHVGNPVEYNYEGEGELRNIIWERNVQHSIRPDLKDGVLLPYHKVLEYLAEHPDEDPRKYVAFVPDDQFWSFSFGSEHVTNDGAIGVLLSVVKALQNIRQILPSKSLDQSIEWIDARINELWGMRGAYPGLGSALAAFGVGNGTLIAYEIERILASQSDPESADPWTIVEQLFLNPSTFPEEIRKKIGKTLQTTWKNLPDERRMLLKLLSRFELTAPQTTRYYVHEDKDREDLKIKVTDKELLENPYLLYELDRFSPDPILLPTIDRGLFPDETIRTKFPLHAPSELSDALDPRRVRAFAIRQLESASLEGHTLKPRNQIIQEIRELDVQPACPVTGDHMDGIQRTFEPQVRIVKLEDGMPAFQLNELFNAGEKIRTTINKRIKGVRHSANINWKKLLENAIGLLVDDSDQSEKRARLEKVVALDELYSSRISVLIGPAGTGKTTLLKTLCNESSVQRGGVLMLAPTGKARVRMETQTGIKGAQTIAQFLLPLDRYMPLTGRYRLSDFPAVGDYKTVIIDEASMLTEDQLAAVLDAVKGVERIILVGDPRQLPPIGAGRPFLDIVEKLTPENAPSMFPRIGKGYAELTVRRRQIGQTRDDLLLAEWFSGMELDPGADEIWEKIKEGQISPNLKFIRWEHPEELQEKLLENLATELNLASINDTKGFELSIGGSEYNGYVFFWSTTSKSPGACFKVEDWQILSPIRNNPFGVDSINRLIQATYRSKTKEWATKPFDPENPRNFRKIPKPMGTEEILYGDKVIQTKNARRFKVFPKDGALQYVANGEIGIAVGQYKTKKMNFTPYELEVEFSSQPGYKYSYSRKRDFSEEANPALELAYALTVHKTQGSEFGVTFVVIPNPCRLLSRELLYTALTRQRDKVIIFHQGPLHELKSYSEDHKSEAATRLTNLLFPPRPVSIQDRILEDKLIHRTAMGLCVRSKSEVIIATELDHAGIEYVYEGKLTASDGTVRYPDFVIEDSDSGKRYFWEHLGLLNKEDYRKRWERKLEWYRKQAILPIEKGGGANGILLTTSDHKDGGIDVTEIAHCIEIIKNQ